VSNPEYTFAELKPKPKRRGWLQKLIISVGVVIALLAGTAAGAYFYVTTQLTAAGIDVYTPNGQKYDLPTASDIKGPINILLIGSDTRLDQGANYGNVDGARADVIIVLHVSADRKNAVALSFPRDLMVSVPECPDPDSSDVFAAKDMEQINATMQTGGPACTLIAVQALTGLQIPYLAVIDFKGVITMSEAVGGVTVCVAEPINDTYSKLYLDAGEHTLIGDQALAFLRTRHGVGDGSDLSRISNQQVFLTSLVRKLKDEGALTNPFTMFKIGNAALENMTLSNSFTNLGVIFGMAKALNSVELDNITFLRLPVYDLTGDYAGRVAVVDDKAALLFDLLKTDAPVILKEANTGTGAVVAETNVDEATPSATQTDSATATEAPATSATAEPLPEWAIGTNAATTTCSK
jgi:LCP family protein required for cell wall assembly